MYLDYVIGTLDCIESLQIYSRQQAAAFHGHWRGEVDYIRFELATLPADGGEAIAMDLTLRSEDGGHNFIIIGVLIQNTKVWFPSMVDGWAQESMRSLSDIIGAELDRSPGQYEIRSLHPTPRLSVNDMTIQRVLPGFRDYLTAVNHIKRYTFLLDFVQAGSVLECACGTGYGAAVIARLDKVTRCVGLDLSPVATAAAAGNVVFDQRFGFHNIDLATPLPEGFQNVISLETIEHTQNPYQFLELLIDKMAPGGQLLLSLPTEIWGGSHRNPYHFSNWTRQRFTRFLEQYFEDISIYTQRLSLLGPSSFEASEICDSYPNEDADEGFVAILKKPRRQKRPTIVVKRMDALGDVLWITPLLRALRRQFQGHNLIIVTNKTDVFINNPDVDLVFNPQYQPAPDDVVISLDGAYEQRRPLHILHAYAEACGVALSDTAPRLYPTLGQYQLTARALWRHFQNTGITRLFAIHMAASSPDRIWPKAHWKALLEDLLATDGATGIVVLGHGKDYSLTDIGLASPRAVCFTRQCELMHTAAIVGYCDLLIAPDSGLIHIAAAMDTPYLGLFGMADPATRLPYSGSSQAIWADIECRGCLMQVPPEGLPLCRLGHAECMNIIAPAMVRERLDSMSHQVVEGRWAARVQMAMAGATPQAGT